jgi:hypothetical protein
VNLPEKGGQLVGLKKRSKLTKFRLFLSPETSVPGTKRLKIAATSKNYSNLPGKIIPNTEMNLGGVIESIISPKQFP